MRVLFPTTYLPQKCRIATNAAESLRAWRISDEPQSFVIAEQREQEGRNSALDISPTFKRAENHVSRTIRRPRELGAAVVHRSLPPIP